MSNATNAVKVKRPNPGKELEQKILEVATFYESKGWMVLRKTEPPCKVVYIPHFGQKVFMQKDNPYLDFVGVWKERNGLAIFMEAKHTKNDKLTLNSTDNHGIDEQQNDSLTLWRNFRAVSVVLWESSEGTLLIKSEMIQNLFDEYDRRSIKYEEALQYGKTMCLPVDNCDFRPVLERFY